ncbi:MAG TPA: formate dehydrogenase accessory protein FdhE [Deltaproteobacteria bacterium]|nr:formate dehydrogenase accessory protein FdhE [Deltaproteobacteria bacterium]
MATREDTLRKQEKILLAAIKNNPHSSEILNAYKPLIMTRARLVDDLELKGEETFTLDKELFKKGVPLFGQNAFFRESDPFETVARALLPALREGFSSQFSVWDKFAGLIDAQTIRLYDFFKTFPTDGEDVLSRWAEMLDTDIRVTGFLMRAIARVVLEKRSRNHADVIKGLDWEKGYCPMCGAFPDITKHLEGSGQRWLHCPLCGHEWRFKRVVCPCCENDEQKTMSYFHVENRENESCFTCEKCKCYLITVTKVSDVTEYDPDIAVLSLAHLDVIMEDKGYSPIAECEWN